MNSQDWVLVRKVKVMIKELPDLTIPPAQCYMLIETDGCMEGWGDICKWKLQKHDSKSEEKICAYASDKFSPPKSTIDAEIHAVMNSLNSFKIYYLDKEEFLIRTDCQAIISFFNKSAQNKPSRVRWIAFTDFITGLGIPVHFQHIEGKDNLLADALSRLLCVLAGPWTHTEKDLLILTQMEETLRQLDSKPNTIASRHLAGLIISWSITKNWPNPVKPGSSIQKNMTKEPIWKILNGQPQEILLSAGQQKPKEGTQGSSPIAYGLEGFKGFHAHIDSKVDTLPLLLALQDRLTQHSYPFGQMDGSSGLNLSEDKVFLDLWAHHASFNHGGVFLMCWNVLCIFRKASNNSILVMMSSSSLMLLMTFLEAVHSISSMWALLSCSSGWKIQVLLDWASSSYISKR
ncbi:hypothetical protein ZIOFF_026589 [Zingiber officinale]|uniref:Reverse transcriptase RNase H-like domain-containing protein n=1 Tax=Zingiber officinale TaxID=94328 RepID=A0A8J5HGT0_ZINOF|nr:hypothetical protein ZIOFF_026589 [Zingiber officinale]